MWEKTTVTAQNSNTFAKCILGEIFRTLHVFNPDLRLIIFH